MPGRLPSSGVMPRHNASVHFFVVAQITCALLLALSGLAKFRSPEATAEAIAVLRLPAWARDPRVPKLLAWGETLLAAVLVLGAGWVLALSGAVAAALFVAYFLVVARALQFDEPVRCGCFGELGEAELSVATLLRNAGLTLLALLVLIGGGAHSSLWSLDLGEWGWVAVTALATGVLLLSLKAPGPRPAGAWLADVRLSDGDTTRGVAVGELAAREDGVVLLFLAPGSLGSDQVVERRADWAGRPVIPVVPEGEAANERFAWLPRLHEDPGGNLATALGVSGPAALPVDAKGYPAGEVVLGSRAVLQILLAVPTAEEAVLESQDQSVMIRRPIPPAVVLTADRTPLTLRELAATRGQLLVGIGALGTPAMTAIERMEAWQAAQPALDVRIMAPFLLTESLAAEPVRRAAVYDHRLVASEALGLVGQVSAVLIGKDGFVGRPVTGIEGVADLVASPGRSKR